MSRKPTPQKETDQEELTRIAIVDPDRCKPNKCRQECKRNCPVVRMGKMCIEVEANSKIAFISEQLCIGCGICVKKCPYEAIQIINIPSSLSKDTTHRYGPNGFKLHRLPMPRPGQVLGLVGTNGIGKSTALKILGGKLKPNLGRHSDAPDWQEILVHFRGSELQNFFTRVLEDDIKPLIKPQYVDHLPRAIKGEVGELLEKQDELKCREGIIEELDLGKVLNRQIENLSGGELQRFAIGLVCVQDADIYMFDEPSSYLDVRQRLKAAQVIRNMVRQDRYVVCVEHDLSVLDYLSDFVCVLYGKPGAYGVVTMPFSVREGINIFLAGFVPTENLRFRLTELTFKVAETATDLLQAEHTRQFKYPTMTKQLGDFKLTVENGSFSNSEIVVMLGENGTGKTTFIRMLAGLLPPDEGTEVPQLNVSYKPQKISPKFEGTVRQLLHEKIRNSYTHAQFVTDVMKPMRIEEMMDFEVKNLSGGELQRVALVLALGKPADIYLIDEPSAYLDSEQRIIAAKMIKRFILHSKKSAFIVEHDFIMATYLADRVIVYTGEPAKDCTAHSPQALLSGMNRFLKSLGITFRRDPTNHRPRINKLNSVKDQEQKKSGNFFFLDTPDDDKDDVAAPVASGPKSRRAKERERERKEEKEVEKEKARDATKQKGKSQDSGKDKEKGKDKDKEKEKPKAKEKQQEKDEDEQEDEQEEEEEEEAEKPKPKSAKAGKDKPKSGKEKAAPVAEENKADEEDDNEEPAPAPAPKKESAKPAKAQPKAKAAASSPAPAEQPKDDDEDAEDVPQPAKKAAQKKAAQKKTTQKKTDDE